MKFKIPSVADIIAAGRDQLPEDIDLQGWNSDHPIFERLIEEVKPKNIIEVGSWKGRSAMHFAVATAGLTEVDDVSGADIPATPNIFCVDTWLGGLDHVTSDKAQDNLARDLFGTPRIYEQFLRNFADEPAFAKRVYPIRNTSPNGARLLAYAGVSAELIYIDGSHEYYDAYGDMCSYSQLLSPGGVMFGDDFRSSPGVFAAVIRFSHEQGFKIEEVANNYWIFRPLT